MPPKMVRQTAFATGEVDEIVWKRTDASVYMSAAQSLLNVEIGTTGLAHKRKGTTFTFNMTPYAQSNSRMYEFVDKNGVYYVLISANQAFYVFSVLNYLVMYVATVVTPYMTADLGNIDYAQDNDSIILTHPNYAPARIYVSSYGPATFAFQYLDIYPLPAYDFNTINYSQYTVTYSISGSVLTFVITAGTGNVTGFTTAWIGGEIIGAGPNVTQPVGYAIITNVVNSGSPTGNVTTFTANIQIGFLASGFSTFGSQYSIRQPAWSSTLGYPAKVLFFQNRLWMANTLALNNTIFGSRVNSPVNFDVGVGNDTDAIVYAIGTSDSGAIQWMNGGKQLEIYSQNNEFACPQDQNSGLTPSTFSIRQQSAYGASTYLKPSSYINDSYYVNKTGNALINFHFEGVGLTYKATNVSPQSSHLMKIPSNRALQRGSDQTQDNFIYFLNQGDNTITAFQFANEAKLAALTPIEFQDDVELIDICTINNLVYILKFYSLTSTYTLELFDETTKIDCTQNASMASSGVITGLSLLDGYTVQVVYQGQDFGEYLVVGGQITVYNPGLISDTVSVGLLYDVDITVMYLFAGQDASPFYKHMHRIYVDYYQSLDFYVNGKLVPYQNYADIQAMLPLTPQTGTAIVDPVSGYDRFGTFSITQSSPFDLQILGVAYQINATAI